MWNRWSSATGDFYLNVTHPLGLSSRPSETLLVGLLKTASASAAILPHSGKQGTELQHLGLEAGAMIQEGNHVREHFNYTSQGEENSVISRWPLQLFIKPLVFCKMKERLFLVLAGFAQGGPQLSVYHWVTGSASTWPIHVSCSQLIPPQQQQFPLAAS